MLLWKNIASGDREGKTENVKTLCLFQEWKMMNHRHAHRELPRLHTSENWMYYPSVQRRLESHSRNWNDKNMYPHIKTESENLIRLQRLKTKCQQIR